MVAEFTPRRVVIAPSIIADLANRLTGQIITPDMPEYEQQRNCWHGSFQRHPALIVRAADSVDVRETILLARELGLPLAVRSGGHDVSARSSVDDGIVLDLALMRALSIDPIARVARVQPGRTWGEYAEAAQQYGLATSSGDTASVGIGGLTTGGGIGWMVRQHGLTIDHLRSVRVVTADGDIVRADRTRHADLFWAVRGGGGNFGVITEFEFDLKPVNITVGAVFYPFAEAAHILKEYVRLSEAAPEELSGMAAILYAPPLPFIPAEYHGQLVVALLLAYNGDQDAAQATLAPFRSLGTVVSDLSGPMPYTGLFSFTQEATINGFEHAIRSTFLDRIDDEVIATIIAHSAGKTAPFSPVQLRVLGGAMARVPATETAFGHRDARYMLMIANTWEPGADDSERQRHTDWVTDFFAAMQPHARGAYVNFVSDEGPDRVRDAYAADVLRRLQAVKRRYDPTNLFRQNQNITPKP